MKHYIIAFLYISFVSILSCKSNPVEPLDSSEPGRRDYLWQVNSLYLPFNPFTDITGTSSSDIWVCSPGGDADKVFFHFNGTSWRNDGNPRVFSPLSIYSSTMNSVWSAGLEGKIWYYNGSGWNENYQFETASDTFLVLQDIKLISDSEIYAIGQYFISPEDYWGIILKYDQKDWHKLEIPKIRTLFTDIQKDSRNGNIYLRGVTQQALNENSYQFFILYGNHIEKIKSGSLNNEEYGSILSLDEQIYFVIGDSYYEFANNDFLKIGKLTNNPNFLHLAWGRNKNDIFLGMKDGIAHFNGENTIYLYQDVENIFIRKGLIFEKEVFFMGRDNQGNNIIINGKVNNLTGD